MTEVEELKCVRLRRKKKKKKKCNICFSWQKLLPIGYLRLIKMLILNKINFNCSRLYCYSDISYFFSKLTGKSGTSCSKIFYNMTYFKSTDVNICLLL